MLFGSFIQPSLATAQPPRGESRHHGPRPDGDRGPRDGDRGGPRFGGRGFGGPPSGDSDRRRGGGPPPEIMIRMYPVMNTLDADNDGEISASEIENAAASLKRIDRNGDGKLTIDEMRPVYASGREGRMGPPERRGDGGRPPFSRDGAGRPDRDRPDGVRPDMDRPNGDSPARGDRTRDGGARDGDRDGDRPGGRRPGMTRRGPSEDSDSATETRRRGGPRSADRRAGDPSPFFARLFEERDKDGDGKLSGDEIPPQMAGRLDRIDSDGDKAVSREEMQSMMEKIRSGDAGRASSRNRDRGDGGGRPGGEIPRRPDSK